MTDKLRLGMVGCGGMGHRHLFGLAELERAGLSGFELVGACDPNEENARSLAGQARELLGQEPQVATDLEGLERIGGIRAVDVCTLPNAHHAVAVEAMQRGWDVMCEKPMGLTARACKVMTDAAAGTDRILSVAENYRREYGDLMVAKKLWDAIPETRGALYEWDPESTYILEPPFFNGFSLQPGRIANVTGARILAIFGDSLTTDISSSWSVILKVSPSFHLRVTGTFTLSSILRFRNLAPYLGL